MSRLPIRLRLTIVFAAAMAIVFAAAGWFVYLSVASDLSLALDRELRSRAQDLSALVQHGGSLRPTGVGLIEHGESFAEVVASNGRVLDSTPPIGRKPLLTGAELAAAGSRPVFANRASVPGLDEPARMLGVPVTAGGRRAVLVVGATRENRAETLSSLRDAFLLGGPLALVLAALGGYLLAGAALRPIEAMRRRARDISSSSLDERLPVPPARDEVARLGETLNEMLTRIEEGVARERRFVTDASHELRTPLALLKTELELALREGRSQADLGQAIRSAVSETDRLGRIANDLLLLASSEQGRLPLKFEPVDVGDMLETVAGRFRAQAATEDRQVVVNADATSVVVADRLRLEQAVGNMVDNALRHGGGGVTLSASTRNGLVELHVLDEGNGLAAAFIGRAFERFSRGDEARGRSGSGLGLAIVETVARAHGGTAQATNRRDGGADVWIALPRKQ